MKTKLWEVKIVLELDEDSHPRKFIPDTISYALNSGEDALDYQYNELPKSQFSLYNSEEP